MDFRTADLNDLQKIKALYTDVARQEGGLARRAGEVTTGYVENFIRKSVEGGLIIVGEDPGDPQRLVAEVHACKAGIQVFDHVLGDVTLAIHPDFQGKKVGRTIFTIFLEEVARNRPDVGKVELITRESNHRAIRLYESLGFRIEGRLEMRVRRPDGTLEADIPMGWINPNFDFDILGGQDPV